MSLTPLNVGITASFTIASLTKHLLDESIPLNLFTAAFNQIHQTCFSYPASFESPLDAMIILWRIEDIAPDFFYHNAIFSSIDSLIQAFTHLRTVFKGTLIIAIPPFPQGTVAHLNHINSAQHAGQVYRAWVHAFLEKIQAVPHVRLLDLDALQRDFGAPSAFDHRQWYLYKQPFTEAFLRKIGQHLARMLSYQHVPAKKCLLLDCDNTLWGGVIGEDGLSGIQIGPEGYPGAAFYDFQKYLVYLYSQGVLLTLVSKNNEKEVWEVFDKHDGMFLKREHIAAHRINWQAKSLNIQEIANELHIKLDSLVFVDDNPVEILEVSTALPEITSHLLSNDPATFVRDLQESHDFEKWDLTAEDKNRTNMLHAERDRAHLRQNVSPADFIASLALKIDIEKAGESQLERVTQLIHKTNQFNLSSKRYTFEAVQALSTSPTWEIFTLRLSDKFGDYGLVGVAIIEKREVWHIDTFLISCRALGRGVESAFLRYIAQLAKKAGVHTLTADFVLTEKNAPAADFLTLHGFSQETEYRFKVTA